MTSNNYVKQTHTYNSVSYTHLDVYKRQLLFSLSCFPSPFVFRRRISLNILQPFHMFERHQLSVSAIVLYMRVTTSLTFLILFMLDQHVVCMALHFRYSDTRYYPGRYTQGLISTG